MSPVTELRLPLSCVVVLVGASGAGKSAWAAQWFRPEQVVSSDRLRALVGEGEHDQRAGTDAFAVLEDVLARRLRRGLTTVIDTLGLDAARRRAWLAAARGAGMPCFAVLFDTPADVCRKRNRARSRPVPGKALNAQLQAAAAAADALAGEGFDAVLAPGPVRLVPRELLHAPAASARQKEAPMALEFDLQIPRFPWPAAEAAERLAAIAVAAEEAGFGGLWVMDHFLQIPQVGREWEDMLESYTTLGYLAGVTRRLRLGVLVTGITYRNVAHLAKIVATLDVLSRGRAMCGLGAAWFEREHRVYGWELPPLPDRFALLEDALQLLPLMWGPGAPAFSGRALSVPEAICYPRPLQEHVPILVGGSGERRTLALVARYADACNLFGDAATVRRKVAVLREHCARWERDPSSVRVTQLSSVLVAADAAELSALTEQLRPRGASPDAFAERALAGTVDDHIGRFRELAEAGVQTAVVSLADLDGPEPVRRFGAVIAAFGGG